MGIRSLEKQQRQAYFERVSRELGTTEAQLEVAGTQLGAQQGSDWVRLMGLTYDPRTDSMEVSLEALDHLIQHPQEIYVDDGAEGLQSVEIIDADNNKQIIRLRQPLPLPH